MPIREISHFNVWRLGRIFSLVLYDDVCVPQETPSSVRGWDIPWCNSGKCGATCTRSSSAPSRFPQVPQLTLFFYVVVLCCLSNCRFFFTVIYWSLGSPARILPVSHIPAKAPRRLNVNDYIGRSFPIRTRQKCQLVALPSNPQRSVNSAVP